ncbi:MAG: hypothetical protein R3D55_19870 [Chloroflexota bacterium]
MKGNVKIIIVFTVLLLVSCNQPKSVNVATATAIPTTEFPTMPSTALPTATETNTPTPLPPTETAVPATNTPTMIPLETAVYQNNGTVTLDGTIIFDIEAEGIPCFPDIPIEIIYSPTLEQFLVVPSCFEGDNFLYLFQADGTGKQLISAAWDFLNFNNVTWAEDGQSFTYERINSCCLTPPEDAPPIGLVQYDLATGIKTLVATPTPRP